MSHKVTLAPTLEGYSEGILVENADFRRQLIAINQSWMNCVGRFSPVNAGVLGVCCQSSQALQQFGSVRKVSCGDFYGLWIRGDEGSPHAVRDGEVVLYFHWLNSLLTVQLPDRLLQNPDLLFVQVEVVYIVYHLQKFMQQRTTPLVLRAGCVQNDAVVRVQDSHTPTPGRLH